MGKAFRLTLANTSGLSQEGQPLAPTAGWKSPESVLPKGDIEFTMNVIGAAELSLIRMFPAKNFPANGVNSEYSL
jgi:hypothetical protein